MSESGTNSQPPVPSLAPSGGEGRGEEPAPLFVTAEDHLAGFKLLEVEFRTGDKQELKLTAPSRRVTRAKLTRDLPPDEFPWHVVSLCLPAHLAEQGEAFMDSLTPDSAALIEVTAFCLTFGSGTQKKIEAAALMRLMASAKPEPSNGSSAADGAVPIVIRGAGPSSGSASPSPSNKS